MATELPKSLSEHRQFPGDYCAVSGFECIAKLHGFIKGNEFPLQSDPKNEHKGFGDTQFLDKWCVCTNSHFDTAGCVALIEKETTQGRFPLVSLFGWNEKREPVGWHILIAMQHDGKLLLVDPAKLSIASEGKAPLQNLLESNRVNNPERKTLHIFSYQLKPPPAKASLPYA